MSISVWKRSFLWVPGLVLLFLLGCGGADPSLDNTVHLSGKVNFQGKAVPHGKIYFNPSQGQGGTTGFAKISNGQYDTAAAEGRAAPPGIVTISINGYDREGGKMLCRHEIQIQLDANTRTKDFEVPDSAAVKDDPGPPP